MIHHMRRLLIAAAALGALPLVGPILAQAPARPPAQSVTTAGQWPRFRGPDSNPIAENPNLPISWSKTENVEWVTDVPGVGWSSPVVWGNRVFLTAATSDKPMKPPSQGVDFSNEYLAELRKQGLTSAEANKKLYERDREMPDEIVISLVLYCYDLETGTELWEREMYKGRPGGGRALPERRSHQLACSTRLGFRRRAGYRSDVPGDPKGTPSSTYKKCSSPAQAVSSKRPS
jgi:hypothetical protein